MQVSRNDTVKECVVCGRTLLLGERCEEYANGDRLGIVCTLCGPEAQARGWMRAGAPVPLPTAVEEPPRRSGIARLFGRREAPAATAALDGTFEEPTGPVPLEVAAQIGVDAFNASVDRRSVASIARSLGVPRASIVAFSGSRPDVIVTVAWDLSWYQYRVDAGETGEVRLESRGDDPAELAERWRDWNAQVAPDGTLTLV